MEDNYQHHKAVMMPMAFRTSTSSSGPIPPGPVSQALDDRASAASPFQGHSNSGSWPVSGTVERGFLSTAASTSSPSRKRAAAIQSAKDELKVEGPCYLKLLAPSHFVGAIIGKEGANISEIELLTRCQLQLSSTNRFFPGTTDRIIVMGGQLKNLLDCLSVVLRRLSDACGQDHKPFFIKLVVPNSSVSALIGRSGQASRQLSNRTGCCINISSRVEGLQERLVLLSGLPENVYQAASSVCCDVQHDPNLAQHMQLKYNIHLPLGVWAGDKAGPAEPAVPLISPSAAKGLSKRVLVSYLQKASPRRILIKYRLLGKIDRAVKSNSMEVIFLAVAETWHERSGNAEDTSWAYDMDEGFYQDVHSVDDWEEVEDDEIADSCHQKETGLHDLEPAEAKSPQVFAATKSLSDTRQILCLYPVGNELWHQNAGLNSDSESETPPVNERLKSCNWQPSLSPELNCENSEIKQGGCDAQHFRLDEGQDCSGATASIDTGQAGSVETCPKLVIKLAEKLEAPQTKNAPKERCEEDVLQNPVSNVNMNVRTEADHSFGHARHILGASLESLNQTNMQTAHNIQASVQVSSHSSQENIRSEEPSGLTGAQGSTVNIAPDISETPTRQNMESVVRTANAAARRPIELVTTGILTPTDHCGSNFRTDGDLEVLPAAPEWVDGLNGPDPLTSEQLGWLHGGVGKQPPDKPRAGVGTRKGTHRMCSINPFSRFAKDRESSSSSQHGADESAGPLHKDEGISSSDESDCSNAPNNLESQSSLFDAPGSFFAFVMETFDNTVTSFKNRTCRTCAGFRTAANQS